MFWEGGVIIGVLEEGETSDGGRTEEAFWIEGVSLITWELGGSGSGSEEAVRRGLADFLCFDLGEG